MKFKILLSLVLVTLFLSGCKDQTNNEDHDISNVKIEVLINEIIERIRQDYVTEPDAKKLTEGALNGLFSSLDPYSNYLNKTQYKALTGITKGNFGGIGLEIVNTNGILKVIAPIDDTPAQKAGIKPGDIITHINGLEALKLSPSDILKNIQGAPGTEVTLMVQRDNLDPFEIKIIRSLIQVNPVKFHFEGNIGYLRISHFNENTEQKVKDAIKQIKQDLHNKIYGLILDLRNNPGGTLEQAVAISNLFLDSGQIVDIRSRNPSYNQTYKAKGENLIKGVPMVILINGGSASASEVVAGALRDHKRAVVMGTKSFGKGSVQILFSIPGHGGIKLTVAHFFTPKGFAIQDKGIEPDILVEPKADEAEKSSKDHQLERAFDLVRGISLLQSRN